MIRSTDGSQRVLSNSEFDKETKTKRENDSYWLTLTSIQLVPSSKVGIGRSICFEFLASGFEKSLNELNRHQNDYHGQSKFDYKSYLKGNMTEKELMASNPTMYCIMVCNKIGYYLQIIHNIRLKRMSVEFCVDEFGQVWFFYAKDIVIAEENKLELDYEKIIPDFVQNEFKREQLQVQQDIQKQQEAQAAAEAIMSK